METLVRFYGTFRHITGVKECLVNSENVLTIKDVIIKLYQKFSYPKNSLFDSMLENPFSDSLIFLNGIEVNNIKGINTIVFENSEIVFLSINHGG